MPMTEGELTKALHEDDPHAAHGDVGVNTMANVETWKYIRSLPVDVRQRLAADILEDQPGDAQSCALCGKAHDPTKMGFFEIHTLIGPAEMRTTGCYCLTCHPRLDRLLLLAVSPTDDDLRKSTLEDFEKIERAAGDAHYSAPPEVVARLRGLFQ